MSKYKINDVVWFISGTGSALPARIKNVIIKQIGNPTRYGEHQAMDLITMGETVVEYDLANDLHGMTEDTLFSSAEEAVKSITYK